MQNTKKSPKLNRTILPNESCNLFIDKGAAGGTVAGGTLVLVPVAGAFAVTGTVVSCNSVDTGTEVSGLT
jgi:hypothetical protein